MEERIHLGRVAGIRIGASWSLLFIFWLIVWSLARGQLPHSAPGYTTSAYYTAAIVGGVVFYACLLAHELAHAVVARRRGIEVEGIVLWLLGGVSKLKGEPTTAGGEFRIAAAGPATSLALGALFFGLSRWAGAAHPASLLAATLGWLGWVNGLLGVFNLVPAFPLDGGRVFRSALWRVHGDKRRATTAAMQAGQVFGYGFIGLGLFTFVLTGAGFSGLWLAVIGWFLLSASRSEATASAIATDLSGLRARDAMTPDPFTVPVWVTLDLLVEEGVRRRRLSSFPVVDQAGGFAGLITLARIQRVPMDRWPVTPTGAVARPPAQSPVVGPDDDLATVARHLSASADRRVVVVDASRVVGIISPSDLRRAATHSGGRAASPKPFAEAAP
jgi:Zn-dependent protease/CBS domain-containing protein